MKFNLRLAAILVAVYPMIVHGSSVSSQKSNTYAPLSCNVDADPSIISQECLDSSTPLSSLVASAISTHPVIVPCGTCAHVDYVDGKTVTMPSGLHIIGRLHFPTSANVIINTTSVVVQGHLDIGIPDEGNKVKITLYGVDEQYYYPYDLCYSSDGKCDMNCWAKKGLGKKLVAVVGGTVDIQAIDSSCPSWTTLKDVEQIKDPTVNVARGKPTSQSSNYKNDGNLSKNAVDGNRNSITHTGSDTNPWWEVDLKHEFLIDGIKVYNREDCCGSRLNNFELFILNNGNEVWKYQHPGNAYYLTTISVPENIKGDKVKVQLRKKDYLSLGEVEVSGKPTTPTASPSDAPTKFEPFKNIGREKPTSQSSDYDRWRLSKNAVDGNRDSISQTKSEANPWWEIDLQVEFSINFIKVHNRLDCCANRLDNFELVISNYGNETWKYQHLGTAPQLIYIAVPENTKGNKVKIQLRSSNFLSLSEVEISGEMTAPTTSPSPPPSPAPDMVNKRFVVGPDFARCIRPDDDLIITSDTYGGWNKHFEWRAESIDSSIGVISMQGVTTRKFATEAGPGEPIFATEVANLRRDVIFEGQEDDPNDLHGAHFIIFKTATKQTISGVRFKNFGQAGNIGRYPIHFHLSGSSPGSVVSKNVIIDSNQRCVVIHETNEVLIHDNIAYKTRGHCYVLEAGNEVNNTFSKNLGAQTMGLGANNGQSDSCCDGHPHHNEPSTFWITNTENHFIENVAAGALFNGWWFEMKTKRTPLYTFRDNVAHSCTQGLITYPKQGWKPDNGPDGAVLENLYIYKNRGDGFKFFTSGKFTIKNSIIADCGIGIRNFFCDTPFIIENTKIIGRSEDARIRLGWTNTVTNPGLRCDYNSHHKPQLRNVTFSEFRGGKKAIAPYFEGRFGGAPKMGEPLSTMEVIFDSTVTDSSRDPLPRDGAWTMYMEDVKGTMGPNDKGPGFFVKATSRMTAFLPNDQCSPLDSGNTNTLFCENACLRNFDFFPSNYFNGVYKTLNLTNGITSFVYNSKDSYTGKHFDVLLPAGEYFGSFYDDHGTHIVPQAVLIDERRPPERQGCDFVSSPSILFNTSSPAPEVQLFNYEAKKWLWANNITSGDWWANRGARTSEYPIEDTIWRFQTVDCGSSTVPNGAVCYQLLGGESRRRIWAQSNRHWTHKVGAKKNVPSVSMDERWYLEKAHCSPDDPRDCFYIINAENGRRLYQHSQKPDFGAAPGYTSDYYKWYMKDMGSSTPISFIEYTTVSPTAAPIIAQTPEPTRITEQPSSQEGTPEPSKMPSGKPSQDPTPEPTESFTAVPSTSPTSFPTNNPTQATEPTNSPTAVPSTSPIISPTSFPTNNPTQATEPTESPTAVPSTSPTISPTILPTISPTSFPTNIPTQATCKPECSTMNKGCNLFECEAGNCVKQIDLNQCRKINCKKAVKCKFNGKCKYKKVKTCCMKKGAQCSNKKKCCQGFVCKKKSGKKTCVKNKK